MTKIVRKLLWLLLVSNIHVDWLLGGPSFLVVVSAETEVKWTPNEQDTAQDGSSGPLPLSQKQREQLLQLEQAILQSPNPQGTLEQAASANQMDPNELLSLLERNRSDLEAAGAIPPLGGGTGRRRGKNVMVQLASSLFMLLWQSARRHPQSFALAVMTLLVVATVTLRAPRTGLMVSSHRSLFSKGPTTVWNPPTSFIQRHYLEGNDSRVWRTMGENDDLAKLDAAKALAPLWQEVQDNDSVWHGKLRKQNDWQQAAMSQTSLDVEDFVTSNTKSRESDHKDEEEEDEDEQDDNDSQQVLDLFLEHASDILESRQLTEFVQPFNRVRLVVPNGSKKRHAVLVVRGMGDWNRFGLTPLKVAQQTETDRQVSLTYTTAPSSKHAHFDGHIHIGVTATRNDKLKIRVLLAVPKRGHKIQRAMGLAIADSICQSVAASISTRTKQSLARRSQSSRFQGRARQKATQRRQTRFNKEKELEEMAADRRRRWQRKNPNSGHYRPSGDRMKSPNNAMYH